MRLDGGLSIVGLAVHSGPRFARDALGPLLVFYASWKVGGLVPGIAAATVFTVGVCVWERGRARSGLSAAVQSFPSHVAVRGDDVAPPRPAPTGLTARKRLGKRVE